ncbi:universal stress protein [Streptosporangium sandarakinum]|uniref:universal stress protein n=1 Tax=Streptosporangium sandarakinum TaxID=1260955 RepID=UPI0033AA373C
MRARDEGLIVVGYDGSEASGQAVRWAVEEARMRFVPLSVCHVWRQPYPVNFVDPATMDVLAHMGRYVLDRGVDLARGLAPRLDVRGRLDMGSPAATLLAESAAADLVVVGQRGAGGFDELRVGSTASQLAAHAYCPVAVVKNLPRPREDRVVVGVESAHMERGELKVAFEAARIRRVPLSAFCLCPAGTDDPKPFAKRFYCDISVWEEKYPGVEVESTVDSRPYTRLLHRAAEDAGLVVIGDFGDDDPVELPLGVVCQALLREAPCTVIVVPSRRSATSSR